MTREEALEKVRQMSLPKETMEILEALAPELKESEDEQVRKAMLQHFKSKTKEKWCNIPVKDIISWLEKQKEQKPAEWSKNDTAFLNEITDFFENKTGRLQHDLDMYAHWLKSLPERFNLQPKQEWNEEDEKIIQSLILEVNKYVFFAGIEANKIVNFLKSLRPVSKDSLQSWKPSEEQMTNLLRAEGRLRIEGESILASKLAELYEQLKKLM